MRPGLQFLTDLPDEHIEWLLEHGREQQIIANTAVFREGEPADALVFVLEGLLGVRIASLPDRQLATLGPGELLGEMSFLEERPATATVLAVENSLLLKVPVEKLRAEMTGNPPFAAALYRAFAVTGSRRLREREQQFGALLAADPESRAQRSEAWDRLRPAIEEFKHLLFEADKASLKEAQVPEEFVAKIRAGFPELVRVLDEHLGDDCGLHESVREELGARVQREVLPYILLTGTAERLYAKPRGYAGDYLSIDWIYADEGRGSGRLGPLLDRCFLDEPAARAVRNRRGLLAREIRRHLDRSPDRPVAITTMACGPAREVFDVFEQLSDPARLQVTLIDIDQEALDQVRDEVERRGLSPHVRLFHGNLVYLALGRQKIDLADQDLMYSIGLIDYFNDKLVGKLMNYGHRCLRPGGELILGNFHPKNPDKALMDYVFDWRLLHRSEEDMNRLYRTSDFGRPCSALHFEEAGVNLFAVCNRE